MKITQEQFENDFAKAEKTRHRKTESLKSLIDQYRKFTGQTRQEAAEELAAEMIKKAPEKTKRNG